jgi:hypothetical protein
MLAVKKNFRYVLIFCGGLSLKCEYSSNIFIGIIFTKVQFHKTIWIFFVGRCGSVSLKSSFFVNLKAFIDFDVGIFTNIDSISMLENEIVFSLDRLSRFGDACGEFCAFLWFWCLSCLFDDWFLNLWFLDMFHSDNLKFWNNIFLGFFNDNRFLLYWSSGLYLNFFSNDMFLLYWLSGLYLNFFNDNGFWLFWLNNILLNFFNNRLLWFWLSNCLFFFF